MNKSTDRSLGLDNDVGDAHFAAEGGQEDDELDGVNVGGDDDKAGLLGLNQGDAVVETVLDEAAQVTRGLNVLANAEVAGALLKERVLGGLGGLTLGVRGSSGLLGRSGLGGLGLLAETKARVTTGRGKGKDKRAKHEKSAGVIETSQYSVAMFEPQREADIGTAIELRQTRCSTEMMGGSSQIGAKTKVDLEQL